MGKLMTDETGKQIVNAMTFKYADAIQAINDKGVEISSEISTLAESKKSEIEGLTGELLASVEEITSRVQENYEEIQQKVDELPNKTIPKPVVDGTDGQFLKSNGDGTTSWVSIIDGNEVRY